MQCQPTPPCPFPYIHIVLQLHSPPQAHLCPPPPNHSGEVIGQIQPGENVLVLDAPRCADGYTWWFIHSVAGIEGWTAEGDATGYWLTPIQPLSADWSFSKNSLI